MSNDLIEERNERTRKRKKFKRKMDSIIGLSFHDEERQCMELSVNTAKLADKSIRLLDEGYIDNGFVIKKGTLEKFLNGKNEKVRGWKRNDEGDWELTEVLNLTDDFVGTVNLGHMDFSTFPYIIGEWRKEDLSLVDIENDRKALDVKLHLDKDSVFVKELKRQPYDIGVSAEFYYSMNDEDTESLSEMLGYWMPVIDEIYINAYGLVGECGNVNSSGLELKGDTNMADNIKDLAVEVEEETIVEEPTEEELTVTEEQTEETVEEETAEEELVAEESEAEEEIELSEADAEEISEDASEEVEGEEVELDVNDETEDDEADGLEEVLSVVNELKDTIAQLTEKVSSLEEANCKLKKTNKRLSTKLEDEKKKKEAFIENAKSISVKLGVNEDVPKKENKAADAKFAFGDGIGD